METKTEKAVSHDSKTAIPKNGNSDKDIVEKAKSEYAKRRQSQLASIKKTDKKLLRQMLYEMVLGRHFEEKSAEVYRMGKIGGFCHLYIGQEAIAIGSMMALEPDDMVITAYRDISSTAATGSSAARSALGPVWHTRQNIGIAAR
jgi:pyruvate dehydrogenase E1 component alpha subunit